MGERIYCHPQTDCFVVSQLFGVYMIEICRKLDKSKTLNSNILIYPTFHIFLSYCQIYYRSIFQHIYIYIYTHSHLPTHTYLYLSHSLSFFLSLYIYRERERERERARERARERESPTEAETYMVEMRCLKMELVFSMWLLFIIK